MSACKLLVRSSLSLLDCTNIPAKNITYRRPRFLCVNRGFELNFYGIQSRSYGCTRSAISMETHDFFRSETEEPLPENLTPDPTEEERERTILQDLILKKDDVSRFMKMERRIGVEKSGSHWFPYLDRFKAGNTFLSSRQVLEAVDPCIMEVRKEKFRNVVSNRSYSVCLVVEGLCDYGNVSAVFRSADALGIQSVHVVSCDVSKRYKDNRHVSMGAEKWLDIELWNSTKECFDVLKSRGYRIATTHVGMEAVSIYDMDWSCPTAIVVGNENRGISEEALELSDLHCSIPMKGMVDSFNVSVASGILMHHAVCDRTHRLGSHGDLTPEERQILLAEFSLRHSNSAVIVAHEYAKRNEVMPISKL